MLEDTTSAGFQFGGQVYVWSERDQREYQASVGESRPGKPMAGESQLNWYCATKPIVAIAVARLVAAGKINLRSQVASYLPDLGDEKGSATIWDLLTHKVAFTNDPPVRAFRSLSKEDVGQLLCSVRRLPLEAGQARYSAWCSWAILGEVIHAVSGLTYRDYVERNVFEPLGMIESQIALDDVGTRDGERALTFKVGPNYRYIESLSSRPLGGEGTAAFGGLGPIRDLGRFYRHLLGIRLGRSGLVPLGTLREFTAPQRTNDHEPHYGGLPWGLGFNVSGRFFGPPCSEATFGHDGHGCVFAFADVPNKVAVGVGLNGIILDRTLDQKRRWAITSSIYEDVVANSTLEPRARG